MGALISVHYDCGIHLAGAPFTMDATRGGGCSVVSHAHSDHVARHAVTVASRGTAVLLQQRYGKGKGKVIALDWNE